MRINARTKYLNEPADVVFAGQYVDRALAIRLGIPDGGGWLATATVCLLDYGFTPAKGCVVIKDYSENEGMLDCLVDQGVVEKPYKELTIGEHGVKVYACVLTEKALAEAKAAGYAV